MMRMQSGSFKQQWSLESGSGRCRDGRDAVQVQPGIKVDRPSTSSTTSGTTYGKLVYTGAAEDSRSASELRASDFAKMLKDSATRPVQLSQSVYSSWRSVALIILIVCFLAATPLSLICTLPAYALADSADMSSQLGDRKRSRKFCLLSICLNLLALTAAIVCITLGLFTYIYVTSTR